MTQKGLTADLLKSCIRTRQFHLGKLVHAKLSESAALKPLISLYSKDNDWVTANAIFENMGDRRDMVSWSAMISCFSHNDMESKAISTFINMLEFGEYPNQFFFAAVIQDFSNAVNAWIADIVFGVCDKAWGPLSFEQQLHALMVKYGLAFDVCVGCSLVDKHAKCAGDGSMSGRHGRKVVAIHSKKTKDQVLPNHFTFSSLMKACGDLFDPDTGE
ncbi:hypothetical protein Vadar_024496 [Vaccinium darrowii]|uniref:Uncharacterized protein n=1 Tax=Vaccinium darrowii TaxID=229202 RepID=A0ACB7YPR1_9ERIC|nr:hypothetical protein Vadar_024496 [Vaccinium darrowii]